MPITYTITIDRNHDGIFEDDITADVIEARWSLGLAQPYDSIAQSAMAQIVVHNPTGAYSPERSSLDTGTRVCIQSDDGITTRTQFIGYIGHIAPSTGDYGEKIAVIHLHDAIPWLENSPVTISPQVDVTADTVIDLVLNQAIIRRAVIGGYCIIDIDGYNLIDSVNIFPTENITRTLESGKTQFAYVGDWWDDTVPAYRAIREVVASERGRFYCNREGEVIFLNRHYTLVNKTLSATFTDDMHGLHYTYGDYRLNRLSLVMTPREIGPDDDRVLWQLDAPQRRIRETEVILNLRFLDDLNQPIGMLEFDRLVYEFNTLEDGTGTVVEDGVSVEILQTGFTSMQVQITNDTTQTLYLTTLTVRGKPLYRRDPLEIVVSDAKGLHIYGLQSETLNLSALSDIDTAQAFAEYEVTRRKHPSGIVHTLTASTHDHPTAVLSLTLFDRIRITETQTGHSAQDYFIIAESHHVVQGGTQHIVTWMLEPADSQRFVIVDDSTIDDADRLITPY